MITRFYDLEKFYENWCKENVNGYVFNYAGGKTGNVLHIVGCRHLTVPSRIGTYTTRYPKFCSTDIKLLSDKADEVSNPYGWRRCKACFTK
ncbi:hypothetical protein COJ85_08945 [Bacillus sp. AFS076308]|uniref:hypothetical protein n=1 Tax=unclassified Bacillus (in: firmicutes) TaxID=185979 RepID=UPI000BF9F598|nr:MULTISPECIES: hypothetical protein [unclassified Bacillus (in: firmicutes)]PFO05797.1 hypothetical protein COJ85_08945 [Bacillus sp. AFS076308]PGV54175.1 hypothetical protein COD92_05950 [Bacillus sp. AFS037270]